ncbi:hypothetical protein [Mucilaginibacter phyllosphaerae]|uniref:Uncharacterized protein n=1 Tax=Mucilaginibacter phyllosphaerae TaxID=1812349 RepID=A0ABR6I4N1_9SPHI|nr:hypothetical protein [Mucilaginibacter phyllosphaerae]MBB3967957.1 hypothetical protein [Mucilaginibacter phyllosphaerae]
MRKNIIAYLVLLGGLLLTSCVKQQSARITLDVFLKATTGARKDIGTAD